MWRQVLSLFGSAAILRLRRLPRAALTGLYAAYAWAVFALIALSVWILMAVVPGAALRWAIFRRSAMLMLRLAGISPVVGQGAALPGGPCVMTANHSSMLDGLVLTAVLPNRLVFVAAVDFARHLVTRLFLRRLGVEFVERRDRVKAAGASEVLQAAAGRGATIVFFPEGRMSRTPGLQPFRLGAFAVAAKAEVPVVPITIRGTESILRGTSRLPRRGRIQVFISSPITASQGGWAGAVELRNRARAAVLRHLDEPDLEA